MKTHLLSLALCFTTLHTMAQNPGLAISEVLVNPAGTDSPFEWVELVATDAIDFSVTPYSVVVSNNGTATANGWIAGGTITYGFAITSGAVSPGDVVYVGGSSMAPTGTKLRVIDTGTQGGDGFGNSGTGAMGNGGANADGIAVFNMDIATITPSSVPVDAIFYGTGAGIAVVNGGADGYQLPVNDQYAGGKLQNNSFIAGDPASDASIRATGFFNTTTDTWFGQRSWAVQAAVNDNTTGIQLGGTNPPGTATITSVTQTVDEAAGTISVSVTFTNANTDPAKIAFALSSYTNATQGTDFSWTSDTLTIPASSNGTFPFVINLSDDALAERTERIIVKMTGGLNVTLGSGTFQIIYVTDNDYTAPVANNELQMSLLSSFSNGAEGTNSAEIVAYDPTTERLFIANSIGAKLDIVNFSDPSTPTLLNSISMTSYGNINSLTVHDGVVAAAVENSTPQSNGFVVFFDADGTFISQVEVGAMPDMITFNNDHTKVVVACEGEPNTTYASDPEGSIAIIDLTPGYASLTNANVAIAGFTAYNGQEAALRAQGIRIFGPGSTAAQDFEPEYITIADDNQTAFVSLQENNAMAVVNLATATVTEIRPLGLVDYSVDHGLDASDQTAGVYISSIPVKGTFMPDALAHATIAGSEYIFSANEGDAREYTAITDVARLSATSLDATVFPDQQILKHNQFLGRLNALQATGDTDNDGDKDEIHLLGTRSFSIWNAVTGALVFDSKDLLEQITSTHPTLSGLFNASNTSGSAVSKNRSDDKGPEPEGVATAFINGNHYLFVSLERVGGVLTFNVDNPTAPVYSGYYNNRTVAVNGPDRGAEGIIYISAADSPNGKDLVLLANEISSTLSVYELNTCVELAGAVVSAAEDTICDGETVVLSVTGDVNSSLQWLMNDNELIGETGTSLSVIEAGDYRVYVSNSVLGCADTSVATTIMVNALPVVGGGSDQVVCADDAVTLSGSGAQTYTWDNSVVDGIAFAAVATTTYTVTGTAANGCENTDEVIVTVNTLPAVDAGTDLTVCEGETIILAGSGADSYDWDNGVSDNVAFAAAATTTYTVTGTAANGCEDTDEVVVTVNSLPAVNAGSNSAVCLGSSIVLTATGADNYTWNNGVVNGVSFEPSATQTYTVTGEDANGCENTDDVTVTVNSLPVVDLGEDSTICANHAPITLDAGAGFSNYSWSTGALTQTISVSFSGVYNVTVTDANGCQDTDAIVVTVDPCLGLEEQAAAFQLYPNPSPGQFVVKSNQPGAMTVIVRNITGQLITTGSSDNGAMTLDLTNQPAGIYLLEVGQLNTKSIFQVVIAH